MHGFFCSLIFDRGGENENRRADGLIADEKT
jgi:hypothetical protein